MSTVAKASITLTSVSDAYSVSLTPSVCVIHADFDGSNPVLTNAYTFITVYCGEVQIPFTVEMVTASHVSIGYSLSQVDDYTYRLAITDLHYSLLEGGLDIAVRPCESIMLHGRFLFSVERESTMLDWIQAWESNKTTIGAASIITPKLFVGKKITGSHDSLAEVPGLTGVYIGPSENDSCGLYGYKNSIEIFHLDETGGKIGGWDLSQDGLYSSNGKLRILSDGSIRAVNDEFDTIWEVCSNGSASFALGNVKFYANGDAEFKGKITSSEGNIAGWTITDSLLHCVPIALSAIGKYIALANISSYPLLADGTWDGDHFSWVQQYGGAALYYTSSSNFGFTAYNQSAKQVFSAGSTNLIAGWSFDENALWTGTKNNNSDQYTDSVASVTIGTEGLRGYSWYINTNGTASFVKGLVIFGQTSGTISGWTIDTDSIYRGVKENTATWFTNEKGSITIGSNGIRGYKWRLDSDGSGSLGGGGITWDADGNVYLASTISLSWGNISGAVGNKLTYLNQNGIYTGTLTAQQVNALTCTFTKGTIGGWTIDTDSLSNNDIYLGSNGDIYCYWGGIEFWRIDNYGTASFGQGTSIFYKEGSGSLAGGNIQWTSNGDLTINGTITSIAGKIGGWDIGAAKLSTTGLGYATLEVHIRDNYFLHINDSVMAGLLTIRADDAIGVKIEVKPSSMMTVCQGINISCLDVGHGRCIETTGDCFFNAREGEHVNVHGLSLNVHSISSQSDSIRANDDIVIFRAGSTGTYALPSPSLSSGKIIFIKKLGGDATAITGDCYNANNSGAHNSSENLKNGVSLMYVCDGNGWIQYFCG